LVRAAARRGTFIKLEDEVDQPPVRSTTISVMIMVDSTGKSIHPRPGRRRLCGQSSRAQQNTSAQGPVEINATQQRPGRHS
jgi:hypothetical protein